MGVLTAVSSTPLLVGLLHVIPIHDETKPESHIGWTDEKGPNQGVAK